MSGQRAAAELAKALKAKVVVPMNNGDLDLSDSWWGFQKLVKKSGTIGEFAEILREVLPNAKLSEAPPGVSVSI